MRYKISILVLFAAFSITTPAVEAQTTTTSQTPQARPAPNLPPTPTLSQVSTRVEKQNPNASIDSTLLTHIQNDAFSPITTCAQLPKVFRDRMKDLPWPLNDNIADPGKRWNDSDVVIKGLPGIRLMFAAANSDYCIILCEIGGFAYHREVYIYDIKRSIPALMASGYVTPTITYTPKPPYYKFIDTKNLDDLRYLFTHEKILWGRD